MTEVVQHTGVSVVEFAHLRFRVSVRPDGTRSWAILHDGVDGEIGIVSGIVDSRFSDQLRIAALLVEPVRAEDEP